jgi:CDP-diacylglycerol--glycerol-3-phosphate 3-phosphatidyltransferase
MRALSAKSINPIASALIKARITADQVTIFGAALSIIVSAKFLSQGEFLIGGILLSLIGLSDLLDGTMARLTGKAGPWGAFLDSTLDRIVDGAIYGSLIYFYSKNFDENSNLVVALLVGLLGAFVTSYTRARWESLGVVGKVGLAERSERSIAMFTGLILTGLGLDVIALVIYGLAFASAFTVFQRVMFVRKQLKK